MKTIPTALQTHLNGDTTLAELIKITRADGVVKAFTSFDRDLVVGGVTYKADGSFWAKNLKNAAELKANNFEVTGLIDSDQIDANDVEKGVYDHARVDVYICNWAGLTQGVVQLRRGWLGEVALVGGKYVAQMRGLHDFLQRRVGDTYTPECRHNIGEGICSVALEALAVTGTVTSVTDNATFEDYNCFAADAYFNYGKIVWTSGANQGLSMEVKDWDGDFQVFKLWLPMPNNISINDAYKVYPGCDKRFSTCKSKFSNAVNFGGFPHLPGLAKILQYPDSK